MTSGELNNPFVQRLLEVQASEETFSSKWDKFFRFLKIVSKRPFVSFTNFEKLILKEPNDCSIVSKYADIETFSIMKEIGGIYIDAVDLCALRIPHPLRRHLGKLSSVDFEENCKTLTYDNLQEKVQYLKNLDENLNELPLVVIVHGLGGQMSQFEDLLMLLSQSCDCFAIDLPGFGHSRFTDPIGNSIVKPSAEKLAKLKRLRGLPWEFYHTDSIVELLATILETDEKSKSRKIILVAHSMGTHIATKLNIRLNKNSVEQKVVSLVFLSPPDINTADAAKSSFAKSHLLLKFFKFVPPLLNLFRVFDRLGGLYSGSILRMVANDSSIYTKIRQIRWNLDSDSHAWMRYAEGFQRVTHSQLITSLSYFQEHKAVLLLCGEEDKVTPVNKGFKQFEEAANSIGVDIDAIKVHNCGHSIVLEKPQIVSGVILQFLINNIDKKLDPSFVLTLQAVINGDKWGLKNLAKWKSFANVSDPIINPVTGDIAPLLAMKTLRNNDEAHSPEIFEAQRGNIIGIVDISATGTSDSYDPNLFQRIEYRKLPTVSKIPPDNGAIRRFIGVVDELLSEEKTYDSEVTVEKGPFIAVHCHYGFNRTGYLICCYLIEKLGWTVTEALQGFKVARAPGIRHQHFIDNLYLRYADI